MDKINYIRSNIIKIEAYNYAGYIAGKNLILTFESEGNPLDPDYVDYLIAYYFGQ